MSEMKSLTLNDKKYDGFVDPVARAMGVINSASGESVSVTDSSSTNLYGFSIFGRTIQNGTPTPDSPAELESVGDSGSIAVNVTGAKESQSMTVATPNGLPGIPVASGGNYTDANGQQWICDEIDFDRGVYVKRLANVSFDENSTIVIGSQVQNPTSNVRFEFNDENVKVLGQTAGVTQILLSNYGTAVKPNTTGVWINDTTDFQGRLSVDGAIANTVEQMKGLLAVNPIVFIAPLAKPIETPLSEEELAAYADLHTYRDNTTISNDASAHMEIEYVMDAKKYIDSKIASGLIHQATVE